MIETTITCEKCGVMQESTAYLAQHLKTMHGLSAGIAIELAKEMRSRKQSTEDAHSAAKTVMAWLQDNPDCLGIELLFRIEEAIEEQNEGLKAELGEKEKAHADALTLLRWASDCWQDGELRGDFDDCVDAIRAFLPTHPTPAREG